MVCLLLSGALTVIGLYLRGPIIDPAIDMEAFSRSAVSPKFAAAWWLLLPSLCIQCYGWAALYVAFKDTPHGRLAFWAVILSVAGNLLFLPLVGVIAFITPEVGRLWLAGVPQVAGIAEAGLGGPQALPFMIGSAALLLIGSVLMGTLLWRAPGLPRWTAIPYVYHALALTFVAPFAYPLEIMGGVVLLITSAAIARSVWSAANKCASTANVSM